jgi:hypothetical protein
VSDFRPITADHVHFDEAIVAYRTPSGERHARIDRPVDGKHLSYILLDFRLPKAISCGDCRVLESFRVTLEGGYAGFVSPVELPTGLGRFEGHRYSIALSTILSFATGRSAKAPRNRDYRIADNPDNLIAVLGLQFPVLFAGSGANLPPSDADLVQYQASIEEAHRLLLGVSYESYVVLMRAMRLIQLAHNSVRDDFALGFYLLVSAIETLASTAIAREEVAERHPSEQQWTEVAKRDPLVKELLATYKDARGKNQYLKKRFVTFILRYCPPAVWAELENPLAHLDQYLEKFDPPPGITKHEIRQFFQIYPEDLPEDQVSEVLENLYNYRSIFTHKGQPPPHRSPTSSKRYFDKEEEFDPKTGKSKTLILPNYRLVAFLVQRCAFAYGRELLQRSRP